MPRVASMCVLHIKPFSLYPSTSSTLTAHLQHTLCPCRFFLLERYKLWSQNHDRDTSSVVTKFCGFGVIVFVFILPPLATREVRSTRSEKEGKRRQTAWGSMVPSRVVGTAVEPVYMLLVLQTAAAASSVIGGGVFGFLFAFFSAL